MKFNVDASYLQNLPVSGPSTAMEPGAAGTGKRAAWAVCPPSRMGRPSMAELSPTEDCQTPGYPPKGRTREYFAGQYSSFLPCYYLYILGLKTPYPSSS
jgi:hypothetical protein